MRRLAAFICLGKIEQTHDENKKSVWKNSAVCCASGRDRGVIQSNRDLMTALERLGAQYEKLAVKPLSEADQAVLLAVQITLNEARKAQSF
jgi:hypothetical protein